MQIIVVLGIVASVAAEKPATGHFLKALTELRKEVMAIETPSLTHKGPLELDPAATRRTREIDVVPVEGAVVTVQRGMTLTIAGE